MFRELLEAKSELSVGGSELELEFESDESTALLCFSRKESRRLLVSPLWVGVARVLSKGGWPTKSNLPGLSSSLRSSSGKDI